MTCFSCFKKKKTQTNSKTRDVIIVENERYCGPISAAVFVGSCFVAGPFALFLLCFPSCFPVDKQTTTLVTNRNKPKTEKEQNQEQNQEQKTGQDTNQDAKV